MPVRRPRAVPAPPLPADAAAVRLQLAEALASLRAAVGRLDAFHAAARVLTAERDALRRVAVEADRWLAGADPGDAGALRAALAAWRVMVGP